MDPAARHLSITLDSVAKALAQWTVARHAELDPTLAERYGDRWCSDWTADVKQRVHYLAQALAVRRPVLFEQCVTWAGHAFAARSIGNDDLRRSLQCLSEVVSAEMPDTVAPTVIEHIDAAIARLDAPAPPPPSVVGLDRPHGTLVLQYLEALLQHRAADAEAMIVAAAESGVPVMEICEQVLRPAHVEIGRMWHMNEITVADEHFVTATTDRILSMLRPYAPQVEPKDRLVIVTTVAEELHCLGARMVAERFEMDGWRTIYLGANMPTPDLVFFLQTQRPDVMAISLTSVMHLRTLGEAVETIRAAPGLESVRVLVGGAPFQLAADLWEELGAHGCGETADEALQVANRLMDSG